MIPLLFILAGIFSTHQHMNVTGMLNDREYQIYAYSVCILLLIWLNYVLHGIYKRFTKEIWIIDLLILCALCIPYMQDNPFVSFLHIFTAYAAFIDFSFMIVRMCFVHRNLCMLYVAGVIAAFLTALTAGGITALTECIIAIDSSVVLTSLYVLKNR